MGTMVSQSSHRGQVFVFVFVATLLCVLGLLPHAVSAHERRIYDVGGKEYTIEVGFLNEPVSVGDRSGVDFHITRGMTGVDGLEKILQVEVGAGIDKRVLNFEPVEGEAGAYQAAFYPSVATTYTFRIFGTINNVSISFDYACNPSGESDVSDTTEKQISDNVTQKLDESSFGCPSLREDMTFPAGETTLSDVSGQVKDLQTTIVSARAEAHGAQMESIVAIALGALGFAAGAGVWMGRRK